MSQKCHSLLRDSHGKLLGHVGSVSVNLEDRHIIPEHFHPEDQLIFASRGVMTVRTSQGIWVVPPMRAVWIPAGTPHSVAMTGHVSMRTLYFLPGLVRSLPDKCFVMNVSPLLRELVLHACKSAKLRRSVPAQRTLIDLLTRQLKAAKSQPLQLPRPTDARALKVVLALWKDPGGHSTLDELCRTCGASRRTIQRIFLSETKMSFARWRQQLRLMQALRLLASGEKVSTAAMEAGYDSPSAFICMFRKQFGTTPAAYFRNQ